MPTAHFPRALITQLQDLAQQSPDTEICGLIGAIEAKPSYVYPIANVADNPERHFLLDAKQQIDAMRQMRERHEDLFAIYHSHPNGSPKPSPEDVEKSAYPDTLYLIITLANTPQIHGFYLRENALEPVEISLA